MCAIIPSGKQDMKLPHFSLRKKVEKLNRRDEEVFAEAKELALLRLEQSIADRRILAPTMNDNHGLQSPRKITSLF
jgi:hypothetical protein